MSRLMVYVAGKKTTGSISTWVRKRYAAIKDGIEMHVPCEGCSACCACGYDIEAGEKHILAKKADGSCAHLLEGKCSIYSDRPSACRTFDCREFLFSGIVPDRKQLIDAVHQWDPLSCIKTNEDREILVAMKIACDTVLWECGDAESKAMSVTTHYQAFLPQARTVIRQLLDHPEIRAIGLAPPQRGVPSTQRANTP